MRWCTDIKINFKLFSLSLTILVYFANCLDFGCLGGGGEYTSYYTDILVLEITENGDLNTINKISFSATDWQPEINNYLDELDYTLDGIGAIYDRNQLFDRSGITISKDSLRLFLPNKIDYSLFAYINDYDAHPTLRSFTFSKSTIDTLIDPIYDAYHLWGQANFKLYRYDIRQSKLDTIYSTSAQFTDSLTFATHPISHTSFDVNGDVLFVSANELYKITSDSTQTRFFYNSFFKEAFLVRWNNAQPDTLYKLSDYNSQYSLQVDVTETSIFIINNGNLLVLDYDGTLIYEQAGISSVTPSQQGSSFIDKKSFTYHNIITRETINLSDFFDEIDSVYPSENKLAVLHSGKSFISEYDLITGNVLSSRSIQSIPPISTSKSRQSDFYFESPYYLNGNLSFLYVETGYYDDPDDPCD